MIDCEYYGLHVCNDKTILYPHFYRDGSRVPTWLSTNRELVSNKTKGVLSEASKRKINRLLYCWGLAVDRENEVRSNVGFMQSRRLVFITLTLTEEQKHDDAYAKRHYLGYFLARLGREFGVKNYLWVAEKQKNGNIHFHIVTDTFMSSFKMQQIWNEVLMGQGYLAISKKAFKQGQAPSTHVRVIEKTKDAISYIGGYLQKKKNGLPVEGRLWGRSDSLYEIIPMRTVISSVDCRALLADIEDSKVDTYSEKFFMIAEYGMAQYGSSESESLLNEFMKLTDMNMFFLGYRVEAPKSIKYAGTDDIFEDASEGKVSEVEQLIIPGFECPIRDVQFEAVDYR